MPKLSGLKPKLAGLTQRLSYIPGNERERDKQRSQTQHWRAWYNSQRWRKLRDEVRLRDLYTCQRCGILCAGKGKSAVDHKKPHKGDEAKFFDASNLQLLCKPCHDSERQKEDRQVISGVWY